MADSPKIIPQGTARSKANDTAQRLDSLVPDIATVYSPVKGYHPGADLQVQGSGDDFGSSAGNYGWTCPAGIATVQVECYGGGGGGGGGSTTASGGGGGGGGGEYACEPRYPVIPGRTYSYFAPRGAEAGRSSVILADGSVSWPGEDGLATAFDFRGLGREGGVVANGGGGGDTQGTGTGGRGGTGSVNTVSFDGGDGGTSASGLMSDNPVLGLAGGQASTRLWYRLDDDPTAAPMATDFSQYNRPSVNVIKNAGAAVGPTTAGGAPPQTPYGPQANLGGVPVPGETQGASWGFLHGSGGGYTGGIVAKSFTLASLTTLTVSIWVKGAPDAAGAWDWGATSANGRKTIIGNTEQSLGTTRSGWSLEFVTTPTSATVQFFCSNNAAGFNTISMPAPSAVDGNWHQVTATYQSVTNGLRLYLDGALQTVGDPIAVDRIAAGTVPVTLAINASTLSYNMKGYLSNAWVATTVAPLSYVQFAFGQTVATGGSGGGASGGSAGAGNPGANASAGTGGLKGAGAAAASALLHGSGAGGDGGNSGADGIDGEYTAPFAGGGGGAGANATVTAMTVDEVPCVMSGSYTGLDSQGESTGQLYTVSADPSPAEVSPWVSTAAVNDALIHVGGANDRPFQGTMNAVVTFPSLGDVTSSLPTAAAIKLNNTALTLQKCWLRLTVDSPNACNLVIGSWNSNTVTDTLASDGDILAGGYGGASSRVFIPAGAAGRQVVIPVDDAILTTMLALSEDNGYSAPYNSRGIGLLIGTLTGSPAYQSEDFGAWDSDEAPDWNALIHGADQEHPELSATLLIGYTSGAAAFRSGGRGAPGYIVVSYITPEGVPVSTVLPDAVTDAGGNAVGAGFTADATGYNVWQPGSSPKTLETAHNVTLINGWANSGANPVLQYRLLPGGFVHLTGVVSAASRVTPPNVLGMLPAGYMPARTQFSPVSTLGTTLAAGSFLQVNTSGNISLSTNVTTSNTDVIINIVFPTT